MPALPKRKITSTMRGTRRKGNKPKIAKNVKQAVTPRHKQGLVSQIFKAVGINKAADSKSVKKA